MIQADCSHVAFSDESNWNKGRFRSISLVSASVEDARTLHQDLNMLRLHHGKSEYKWRDIKQGQGTALTDFFFAHRDRMRVDVLVWDIEDSRHGGMFNRDDRANFARMYYHLLHNVLKRRWPHGARWIIYPDAQKEVDWLALERCLNWKSWAIEEHLFTEQGGSGFREFYNINGLHCVNSAKYLLVQLADLFAGLATYSRTAFGKYQQWKFERNPTPPMFGPSDCGAKQTKLSLNDRERLPILDHVRQEASRHGLQVSLESSEGLCTRNPANRLNFWLYTPQRLSDKAPKSR